MENEYNRPLEIPEANRFDTLRAWCPRCGGVVATGKFLVNVSGDDPPRILATFVCPLPACGDLVQVYMRGESIATGGPRQ